MPDNLARLHVSCCSFEPRVQIHIFSIPIPTHSKSVSQTFALISPSGYSAYSLLCVQTFLTSRKNSLLTHLYAIFLKNTGALLSHRIFHVFRSGIHNIPNWTVPCTHPIPHQKTFCENYSWFTQLYFKAKIDERLVSAPFIVKWEVFKVWECTILFLVECKTQRRNLVMIGKSERAKPWKRTAVNTGCGY